MSQQRDYSREFKQEAVQLYESTQKSMSEGEFESGITTYLLSKWVRQHRQKKEQAFPGKGKLTDRDKEMRHLQR